MVVGLLYSHSPFNFSWLPKFSFKFRGTQETVNKSFRNESKYTINKETDREVEIQIDKILDKINENGFGSLNDNEKRFLEKLKPYLMIRESNPCTYKFPVLYQFIVVMLLPDKVTAR